MDNLNRLWVENSKVTFNVLCFISLPKSQRQKLKKCSNTKWSLDKQIELKVVTLRDGTLFRRRWRRVRGGKALMGLTGLWSVSNGQRFVVRESSPTSCCSGCSSWLLKLCVCLVVFFLLRQLCLSPWGIMWGLWCVYCCCSGCFTSGFPGWSWIHACCDRYADVSEADLINWVEDWTINCLPQTKALWLLHKHCWFYQSCLSRAHKGGK